jgi:hypothetical protein
MVAGIALAGLRAMTRIKAFLVALVAGCGGGGGGSPNDGSTDGTSGDGHMIDGPPPAANDTCATATTISISSMHVDMPATTVAAHADLAAPCGTAGVPDVFFKFTLTRREMVYADTFGASMPTSLFFASSCSTARTAQTTSGDALCSAGACATTQSQVVALLDPGTHYLVYASQGAATIHFQHTEVGTGTIAQLGQGTTMTTGTTSGSGNLYACDAGGAENTYWWLSCPLDAGGAFTASTCGGTTNFDTILSLQIPGTESVMCDDDTCSFQSTVGANIPAGAGLYVIAVDGFSQAKHGDYTLSATRP